VETNPGTSLTKDEHRVQWDRDGMTAMRLVANETPRKKKKCYRLSVIFTSPCFDAIKVISLQIFKFHIKFKFEIPRNYTKPQEALTSENCRKLELSRRTK
jgi:hypothetical protein